MIVGYGRILGIVSIYLYIHMKWVKKCKKTENGPIGTVL